MEGRAAQERKTVDVSEVHLSREQQEGAEEQEKENGPSEIGVVHNVLVNAREWIENRQCLDDGNERGLSSFVTAMMLLPCLEYVQNSRPTPPAVEARRRTPPCQRLPAIQSSILPARPCAHLHRAVRQIQH